MELSNEVDPKSLDLAAFAVSPQVKLLGVSQSWASRGANAIAVQAESRARTKYELTLPASVRDIFGQALGKPVTVSISVGDPRPDLGNAEPMIVLDPAGPRALELLTRGIPDLRVRVSRVTPNDLPAFFQFLQRDNGAELAQLPGTQVLDTKLNVKDTLQYVTSFANVEKALHGGFGHAVVVVEPVKWPDTYRPRLRSWVQSTELGLNVIHDADTLYVWVTKLADGSALPNATITLEPDGTQVTSDARGFAKIDLPTGAGKGMRSVTARVGGDVTVYPERMWDGGGQPSNWVKRESQDTLRFFAFDDRGLYRPGERVHVKGWVRATQGGYGGKLVLPRAMHGLRYVVRDGNGQEIKSGQLQPSASYGFDFAFDLPDQATLGYAQVEITANDGKQDVSTGLGIQVAEFRRPEYEVSLRAKEAVHVMGETIGVEAEAKYYTGGALVDTAAQFRVTSQRGSFTPPGRDDYQFGEPPLWLFWERMPNTSRANLQTARVLTGADGIAPLDIVPVSLDPAYPHTLGVEVAVQDVNRQTWAANTELLVHPSRTYVGLKLDRAFIAQGQSVEATLLAVDLDGKAAPGRKVEVRGVRHDTESSQGETKQVERDVQLCTFTSTDAPSKCTFKPAQAGSYELTARVIDDVGRANQTRTSIWVTGPTTTGPSNLEEGQVQVVADRKEYKAGDVAHVLLQSPFAPANASVVIAHAGVRKLEQVRIENATHTLDIPIEAGFAPNVTIMVSLVGSRELRDPGTDAKRLVPAYASGSVALTVPVAEQRLEVIAKPAVAELEPGGHTRIEVTVRDAAHAPVANAETCVIVVDEAVLAMAQYEPGDPIAAMFPELPPDVDSFDTRAYLRLANAERSQRGRPVLLQSRGGLGRLGRGAGGGGMVAEAAMAAPAPMAPGARHKGMVAAEDKAAGNAVRQAAPVLRQSFSSIALFAPKLVTDANGVARTELVLPDDLTRYRIFALAAANGDHFGHGEGTVTARKQLMLRASPPRFLSFGDRFELPVVIENQAASVQSVQLAGRAANAAFTAARGLRVEVPAHDRVEVRLPMAALAAGRATLQLVVKSDAASDATQLSLPVWTPATDEAFATYGSLAQEKVVAQPVHAPSDVFPEFGGLEIATSSTQLAALTDALRYVNEYPFECSEQLASRAITLLALRDVLASFVGAQVPSADEAKA
ncbi:MAG TPA: alpha-2-macroglobulin family protein, partial [Polyangiales bacterium]|nr:alpha-2-macroglobulin family protein [Polyangiales bacterium]